MRKIAMFVEGQTEQIFLAKLIQEIIGSHGFTIDNYKFIGGSRIPRKPIKITTKSKNGNAEYYFVLYDCGGDEKVQSDIRERIESLYEESFSLVLGIRDAYPETDLAKLRSYLYFGIPVFNNISTNIILAINEIESWFLVEETHYPKISHRLSFNDANQITGIDVSRDTTEAIPHPSFSLKQIYIKGGTTYDKSASNVQRTVDVMGYENLYLNVRNRNNSLNELLSCLDGLIP
jgi:hypothetical protein